MTSVQTAAEAQSVNYPANAVPNATAYGIRPGADVTDALNALMKRSDCPVSLYFPDGTYTIHDTLLYPLHGLDGKVRYGGIRLYGQSQDGTVIKLASHSMTDVRNRKPMFKYEAPGSADYFGTRISRMTFLVDVDNAGADGVDFMATNYGGMDYVTIQNNDPQSQGIGLDPGYGGAVNGPFTIDHVRIDGFGVGIVTYGWTAGATFSQITLHGQTGRGTVDASGKSVEPSCGLFNGGNGIAVRGLRSVNVVPAILNGGVMAVVDSALDGGEPGGAAIVNTGSTFIPDYVASVMYARNVISSGYGQVLRDTSSFGKSVAGSRIDEWAIPQVYATSFPNQSTALKLTILDEPVTSVPAGSDWVDVAALRHPEDGEDFAPAFQRGIDSGAQALYVSSPFQLGSTVHVRGGVRYMRLNGLDKTMGELNTTGGPAFQFDTGTADTVLVEELTTGWSLGKAWLFQNNSTKRLVFRHVVSNSGVALYRNGPGAGYTWMTDVGGYIQLEHPQFVWVTGLNSEGPSPQISNAGGVLSIVGFKNERGHVVSETTKGGFTEILGGLLYTTESESDTIPILRTVDGYASIAGVEEIPGYNGGPTYKIAIEETRHGETRVLASSSAGASWANGGAAIPLYTVFPLGMVVPQPDAGSVVPPDSAGDGGTAGVDGSGVLNRGGDGGVGGVSQGPDANVAGGVTGGNASGPLDGDSGAGGGGGNPLRSDGSVKEGSADGASNASCSCGLAKGGRRSGKPPLLVAALAVSVLSSMRRRRGAR